MALEPGREALTDQQQRNYDSTFNNQNSYENRPNGSGLQYYDHGRGIVGLSVEELKVIQECRSDANWKYALPGAAIAMGLVLAGMKQGALSPRGVFFKATGAAVFGNFLGRWTYSSFGNCQDKLAKLQNSHIGDTARKLNEAGVRLPPYLIVSGSGGPFSFAWMSPWHNRGYGSGYRYYDPTAQEYRTNTFAPK